MRVLPSLGTDGQVEMLRDDAYVPFDIDFSDQDGEAKVITGPNMAGKSSCVRATVSAINHLRVLCGILTYRL